MVRSKASANLIATTIIGAMIVYGSLYPFEFHVPPEGIGPVRYFLSTWNIVPGRGDAISNVLLYVPFGFFGVMAIRAGASPWRRMASVTLIGSLLSLTMELTQYYDVGRDTAVSDFYTNIGGTVLGAVAGLMLGGSFRLPLLREISTRPVPSLLIAAWLSYRLYPFVPTIDLHKYWNALKPIVLTPTFTWYDLFRHTSIWLTIFALIEIIAGEKRSRIFMLPFAASVLAGKVLIIDTVLRVPEALGAVVALIAWVFLLMVADRPRTIVVALLFGVTIVAARLEPFVLLPAARPFDWIPFDGFMHGSIEVDVLSFLEKFFLYGGLVYLLARTGLRLPSAAILVAAILFGTSWIERWLPFRSAEVTDAILALAAGVIFSLIQVGDKTAQRQTQPGLDRRTQLKTVDPR